MPSKFTTTICQGFMWVVNYSMEVGTYPWWPILPFTTKSAGSDYRPLHVVVGCQRGLGFRPSDLCVVFQHKNYTCFISASVFPSLSLKLGSTCYQGICRWNFLYFLKISVTSLFNWPIAKYVFLSLGLPPKIDVFGWVVCSTKSIVLKNGTLIQCFRHQTGYVPHA